MEIWVAVITSIIGPIAVIIVELLVNRSNTKREKQNAAKQSILQLIVEDKLAVMEGKMPENHQNIEMEFDDYQRAGGNHYVKKKVQEYNEWFNSLEPNKKEN